MADAGNLGVFKNPHAAVACTLGERLGNIDGIGIAIAGDMDAAHDVIDLRDRKPLLDFLRGDDIDRQVEHLGHRGAALQFLEAFEVARHRDRPALAVTSCLARFGFKPAVKLTGVFCELGHVDRRPQLPDQAGSVPGRAAGELLAFEQDRVAPADLAKVIGDRGADNAAADDDDTGAGRQGCGHRGYAFIFRLSGS